MILCSNIVQFYQQFYFVIHCHIVYTFLRHYIKVSNDTNPGHRVSRVSFTMVCVYRVHTDPGVTTSVMTS